jgi:FixJ family two-component response regulator
MHGEGLPVAFQDSYGVSPSVAIVDDDFSLLRALGRLVRAAGFAVKTFGSAEEFLASDQSVPPRCLVLDVRLAGMGGFELHERLRGWTPPPSVIFITAHDDGATRERARRAGAVHYLRKPFDDATLIDAIHRAVAPRPPSPPHQS